MSLTNEWEWEPRYGTSGDTAGLPWRYVPPVNPIAPVQTKPFYPTPPYPPDWPEEVPHYQPAPQGIHDKLAEILKQELEQAHQRIMEQAQSESLPEIAERLGYPLPAGGMDLGTAIQKMMLSQPQLSSTQWVTTTSPATVMSGRTYTFVNSAGTIQ